MVPDTIITGYGADVGDSLAFDGGALMCVLAVELGLERGCSGSCGWGDEEDNDKHDKNTVHAVIVPACESP